jgi:predicted thioredoxin/glutaredoxin
VCFLFFFSGILKKEVETMKLKTTMITLGIGAAAGAIGVMMLPRSNAARRLADETAQVIEDAATQAANKIVQK